MVEVIFFFALGLVVGHLLGVMSVGLILHKGIDWSRHECRTCAYMLDDMTGTRCGGEGPRSGGRVELTDTCDEWEPLGEAE